MNIDAKLRKLLAVAECEGASDAEKATALHQAARLAEKHAIDLDALGREASGYGETELAVFIDREPPWCMPICCVLMAHFNVRGFSGRSREQDDAGEIRIVRRVFVFGCKPSRDVALYVFTFLRREFLRLASEMRPKRKAGFYRSLACGIIARLDELKKADPSESESTALISAKLETEFALASANFGKARKRPPVDGYRDAFERGKQIEINPALQGETVRRLEMGSSADGADDA